MSSSYTYSPPCRLHGGSGTVYCLLFNFMHIDKEAVGRQLHLVILCSTKQCLVFFDNSFIVTQSGINTNNLQHEIL
jgi:hypothetical protein